MAFESLLVSPNANRALASTKRRISHPEDIRSTPSMESTGAPYVAETSLVEVVGDAASVRLDETGFFGSLSFSNWFHLIRGRDGEWRIVSKLFAVCATDEGVR